MPGQFSVTINSLTEDRIRSLLYTGHNNLARREATTEDTSLTTSLNTSLSSKRRDQVGDANRAVTI